LGLARKQGDRPVAALALADLGALRSRQGDHGAARPLLEESLAHFREAGDRQGIGTALCALGTMALDQGDENAAASYYEESLAAFRQVSERYGIARALEGLARVAVARGQPERAARRYAAAATLRAEIGAPLPPVDRAAHEQRVAAVRASLGEQAFADAWTEGRAMPLEQKTLAQDEGGSEISTIDHP
jgi:tetratricopeptide (TPR) repeat protein